MPEEPQNPFSAFMEGAVALHETYKGLVSGGFTKTEALYLVGQMIIAAAGGQPQPPKG